MTNFEKIKAMSETEMAEFLNALDAGSISLSGDCRHCDASGDPPQECIDCVLVWLRDEA